MPGILLDVEELVRFRYASGSAPSWAADGDEFGVDESEPAAEKNARAGLKDASASMFDMVHSSIPRAGAKLRTGQLIVVTVVPDSN